jgi:alanine racemase
MACVKADAYGHGLVPVAKRLVCCGVDYLGVASLEEGIDLRKAGVSAPVLILGPILPDTIEPLFRYDLTPVVYEKELAVALNKRAKMSARKINIHIKVDTGMGRLGILYPDAFNFVLFLQRLQYLNNEGLFTHLSCADTDAAFTKQQIGMFSRLVKKLLKAGIAIPLLHAANSMGVIGYRESHFNLIRPGLIIYGLYPKRNLRLQLRPVLSLKTKVIFLKDVPRNFGVSYGHTYRTKHNTTLAVLPIGYGDGYPRSLSNKAKVLIKGKRFKIAGRIAWTKQ